jgi:site-specific recombinase XerD
MNRKTFSISFFIKRTKLLKNHQAPIFLRITVDGERAELSIKRSINPKDWDENKESANPDSFFGDELNQYLNQIRYLIYQHQKDLIDKNKSVTSQNLKNAYLNIDETQSKSILQIYQEHNDDLKLKINRGIAYGTYERHVTSRKHLESYIQETYKKKDYLLRDIDHQFIIKYETYLRTKINCCNNTTVKYIKNFGKIIRFALYNDWIRVNPFRNIRFRLEEVDKPYLNLEELNLIMSKVIQIKRIAQVRDVFVFCCFTGLAFVDVKSLCHKDFEKGFDGNIWLKKQRHKSKQWQHVPLLPIPKALLDKYGKNPECFRKQAMLPVLTNQKMNAYLKEVADICGITKNLTTHCARHTFATTVTLANNISIESVSKMLGHSNIRMTQKYARILDSTIGKEMNQLAEKLHFHMN